MPLLLPQQARTLSLLVHHWLERLLHHSRLQQPFTQRPLFLHPAVPPPPSGADPHAPLPPPLAAELPYMAPPLLPHHQDTPVVMALVVSNADQSSAARFAILYRCRLSLMLQLFLLAAHLHLVPAG